MGVSLGYNYNTASATVVNVFVVIVLQVLPFVKQISSVWRLNAYFLAYKWQKWTIMYLCIMNINECRSLLNACRWILNVEPGGWRIPSAASKHWIDVLCAWLAPFSCNTVATTQETGTWLLWGMIQLLHCFALHNIIVGYYDLVLPEYRATEFHMQHASVIARHRGNYVCISRTVPNGADLDDILLVFNIVYLVKWQFICFKSHPVRYTWTLYTVIKCR